MLYAGDKEYNGESLWFRFWNHGKDPECYTVPRLSRWWRSRKVRHEARRKAAELEHVKADVLDKHLEYLDEMHGVFEPQLPDLIEVLAAPGNPELVQYESDPVDKDKVRRRVNALTGRWPEPPPDLSIKPDDMLQFEVWEDSLLFALIQREAGTFGFDDEATAEEYADELISIIGEPDGMTYRLSKMIDEKAHLLDEGSI